MGFMEKSQLLNVEEPKTSADPGVAVDTRRALKYLRACPIQRRQVP